VVVSDVPQALPVDTTIPVPGKLKLLLPCCFIQSAATVQLATLLQEYTKPFVSWHCDR
jgi:hypothetical protein